MYTFYHGCDGSQAGLCATVNGQAVVGHEVIMVWDVSFACDICGRKKGESNHWWMITLGAVPCFDEGQPNQRFTLMPWNAAESQNSEFYHACGQGCAMQAMERFMASGAILLESVAETAGHRAS